MEQWWQKRNYPPRQEWEDEKEYLEHQIQRIYDYKNGIAIEPYYAFIYYLNFYENIDFEENRPKDKYLNIREDLSTKELKNKFPHIHKICYVDKIFINNVLVTKAKFKVLDNKFIIKDDGGFTLNDIAYLGQQLSKINFWFSKVFRIEASIKMNLSMKKDILIVHLESEI